MQVNFIKTNQKTEEVLRGQRTVLAVAALALLPPLLGVALGVALMHQLSQSPSVPISERGTLAEHSATSSPDTNSSTSFTNSYTKTGPSAEVNIALPPTPSGDTGNTSSTPTPTTSAQTDSSSTLSPAPTFPVTLEIESARYSTEIPSGASVYDLLILLQSDGHISFGTKMFGSAGQYINELNGIKEDTLKRKFWIYYINGAKAQVGASQYVLKAGDLISWKLEDEE